MSGIDTLIKLHRRRLDERSAALAKTREAVAAVDADRETLAGQIEAEKSAAANDPDLIPLLGRYLAGARDKDATLVRKRALLEQEARRQEALVAEAFREAKKLETIQESRRAALAAEERRREAQEMDEAAIARAGRQEE
jgi:flagellar FliJ protein